MFQLENLSIKFRLIFLPFLFISAGFISIYTLFNCLLCQTEILKCNIKLINFWFPVVLPWIPILIWLRPRINLLLLKAKNGKDRDTFYYLVAWAAAAVPAVIAQEYVEAAAGTLTSLSSVEQIADYPSSKFYTLEKFRIDKKHLGIQHYSEFSGKYNKYLNFTIFVACPILGEGGGGSLPFSQLAPFKNKVRSWLCLRYDKQISSHLDKEERTIIRSKFIRQSQRDFYSSDLHSFRYLKRVPHGSDKENYLKAIGHLSNEKVPDPYLLLPVYEPFGLRGGAKPGWMLKSFLIACTLFAILLVFPKLNKVKVRLHNNPKPKKKQAQPYGFLLSGIWLAFLQF